MADYSAIIEMIRARSDLLSVVSSCVMIKKTGKSYQGLCPFHPEKTPSFHVYPERQRFHCYGCQKDGDIFAFLQGYHGWSFPQTVQHLAAEMNLEHLLQKVHTTTPSEHIHHQQLKQMVQETVIFYHQTLLALPPSHPAHQKLQERKIKATIIDRYQLGWSGGFSSLLERFPSQQDLLFEAGLITPPERNRSWNRFIDRLVFPIYKVHPTIPVGFGGRIVHNETDQKFPKYLNSPESLLFKKSQLLYGLHIALEHRLFKSFVIVEGYFDVVQMANYDLPCAIAPMGTALGADHIKALLSYKREMIFCFDGDKAGQEAAYKAMLLLLPFYTHRLQASFVTLPPHHDPDSFLLEQGREKFINLLQKRVKIGEYLFQQLQQLNPLEGIDNTVTFVSEAKQLIRMIEDPDARLTLLKVLDTQVYRTKFKGIFIKKREIPSLKSIAPLEWLAALWAQEPKLIAGLTALQVEAIKKKDPSGILGVFFESPVQVEAFEQKIEKIRQKHQALLMLVPSVDLASEMQEQLKQLGIISE